MRVTILALNLALAGVLAGGSAPASAVAAEPVQAIWQESEIHFTYTGRTSFYSCDSLERKVERILKDLGAREDVEARAAGCMGWFAPESFMSVRIRVAMPVTAIPGAGLEPEERSRRELVARVRGDSPADAEFAAQFPAAWKRVAFSRKSRYLEDGDCELVEQLENRVFKQLDIHVVNKDGWCVPGQIRLGQLDLEVEALVALPSPDDAKQGVEAKQD